MNRNQRNTRENRRTVAHEGNSREIEKVRHAQEKSVGEDRHGRKIDFKVETRRANNEYLVHEHRERKTRSNRANRGGWTSSGAEDRDGRSQRRSNRSRVDSEDFLTGTENLTRHQRRFWGSKNQDSGETTNADYFGDYEVEPRPIKRNARVEPPAFDLADLLLRTRRSPEPSTTDGKREKREEEDARCTSEVTTLTVGCSTADRMEFQGDCADDDSVTGDICHSPFPHV